MPASQSYLLLVLGVVLVVLTGLLVWGDPSAEPEPGAPVWVPASAALTEAELDRVTLGEGSGAVVLVRSQGAWRLSHPLEAPADSSEAGSLVAALSGLHVSEPLGPTAGDAYGLRPGVLVEAVLSTGQTVSLRVGDEAPTGRGTYLRLDDGSIRLSRGSVRDGLVRSADSLRSRAVVALSPAGTTAVRAVSAKDGTWSLQRDQRGWWLSDERGTDRADTDAVLDFITSLAALQVDTFVDGPGLLEPAWTVSLDTLDGPRTVVLGEGEGEARMVQGTALAQPALVRLPPSLAALDPARFRARRMLPFATAAVDAYSLTLGGQVRAAERTDEGWSVAAADTVLAELAALEGDRARPVPTPQGSSWGAVTLEARNGQRQAVSFYQLVDGGRVAVDSAGGDPFWVSQQALDGVLAGGG